MHAFSSLVSMENKGCTVKDDKDDGVCVFGQENGWQPGQYFDLHEKMLAKISEDLEDGELKKFVKNQEFVIQQLKNYDETMPEAHSSHIRQIINGVKKPGQFVLYPWGTIDHQVYVDIWNTGDKKAKYIVKIFDLGAGREGEPVRSEYKPIEKIFVTEKELTEFINLLVTYQNARPSVNLYNQIYGIGRDLCLDCVPERAQRTGNCVVKNLLAAIKQNAIDQFGEENGLKIFEEFYLELIKASLTKAVEYAKIDIFDQPMPKLNEIFSQITENQLSFTNVSEKTIKEKIGDVYAKLSKIVEKPQPQPPQGYGEKYPRSAMFNTRKEREPTINRAQQLQFHR
jgi:hypothetical protein